jgi:hypothetical protein
MSNCCKTGTSAHLKIEPKNDRILAKKPFLGAGFAGAAVA